MLTNSAHNKRTHCHFVTYTKKKVRYSISKSNGIIPLLVLHPTHHNTYKLTYRGRMFTSWALIRTLNVQSQCCFVHRMIDLTVCYYLFLCVRISTICTSEWFGVFVSFYVAFTSFIVANEYNEKKKTLEIERKKEEEGEFSERRKKHIEI